MNVLDPFTGLNGGLLWRSKLASGNKVLDMSMSLFCDLGDGDGHHRYIINQVRLEFTFRRQWALFYTLCNDDVVEFVFDIQECNLHVCNVLSLHRPSSLAHQIEQKTSLRFKDSKIIFKSVFNTTSCPALARRISVWE